MTILTKSLFAAAAVVCAGAQAADLAVPVTPQGIRIEALGNMPVGDDGLAYTGIFFNVKNARGLAFADSRGFTLYTFEGDKEPGKSTCSDDCATKWPAALAHSGAAPVGDWSIITRSDGAKQWAIKGKPLYTSVKDTAPGDYNGVSEGNEWRFVVFAPPTSPMFPNRLAVRQVADAGGQALVDPSDKTIYAFDGDATQDGLAASAPWVPVSASSLARPFGDFTIVARKDATKQWAYKAKPLYTFAGDVDAGTALGMGVDKRWQPALVVDYGRPAGVSINATRSAGKVLTTPDGKPLYRQQVYFYSVAAHDLPKAVNYSPIIARAVADKGCVDSCTADFKPYAAPADAQPFGFWNILTRDDGTKQWAYRGYALYTYVGDTKPGDLRGLNIWTLSVNDPSLGMVSQLTKLKMNAETMSALFWTTAYP